MNTITRFFALAALFLSVSVVSTPAADKSLTYARQAQALLGPEVWSQVIRVENDTRTTQYPRVVHALVFEFADVLWFYTSSEGTQSFSVYKGRLAEEKGDFAPLLREIHAGFKSWTVLPDAAATRVVPGAVGELLNGCFIESVVALRERLLCGGEALRPQLLSYYIASGAGMTGHTVLAYETAGRIEVIDSAQAGTRFAFSPKLANDPLKLARALQPGVAQARLFPIDWPAARTGYYSTTAAHGAVVATSG